MTFTAAQIAMIINGKVEGDAQAKVSGFGKIEEAGQGQLAFLANPKYEEYLYRTKASIVLINQTLELKGNLASTLIRVADPYTAFASLLSKYQEMIRQQMKGIHTPSFIDASVKMGDDVFIGAFAYLRENVRIGNNVK